MQIMRDYFSSRKSNGVKAMMEIFRDYDFDRSSSLEFPEFRDAMRQLNLALNDKDLKALFHCADTDGSGTVEFAEFINNFNKEGFASKHKRPEAFFWGKARPSEALPKSERKELWEKATAGKGGKTLIKRTKNEIIKMIADQVDARAAKQTFHQFDEDRSGRISTKEFVDMLKFWGMDVTEHQATDVITTINEKGGYSLKHELIYDAFARAFNTFLDLDNISGGQVGAGQEARGRHSTEEDDETDLSGHPLEANPVRRGPTSVIRVEKGTSRRHVDTKGGAPPGGGGDEPPTRRVLPPSDVPDKEVQYYHRMLKRRVENRFGALRGAFRMADEDASGTCDREELRGSLNALAGSAQVPAEVLDRIIDYADYDGDGDIPYAEFVRVITAPDILNMRALYNTGLSEAVMAGTLTGERALQNIEDGQAEFLQTVSMSHASRPDALRVTAPMTKERAWAPGSSKTTLEAPPPLTPTSSSQPGSPRQRLDMQGAWRSETGLNIQQIQAWKVGRDINWRAGNSASPREALFTLGPGEAGALNNEELAKHFNAANATALISDAAARRNPTHAFGVEKMAQSPRHVGRPSREVLTGALSARASLPAGRTISLQESEVEVGSVSVSECLMDTESAAYARDQERHRSTQRYGLVDPRSTQWSTIEGADDRERRAQTRRTHMETRKENHSALEQRKAAETDKVESRRAARIREQQETKQRVDAMHLCVDSRFELDKGKMRVDLEPPAVETHTRLAPPHQSSHWHTIQGRHRDPPPRDQQRMISSYKNKGLFGPEYRDFDFQRTQAPSSPRAAMALHANGLVG